MRIKYLVQKKSITTTSRPELKPRLLNQYPSALIIYRPPTTALRSAGSLKLCNWKFKRTPGTPVVVQLCAYHAMLCLLSYINARANLQGILHRNGCSLVAPVDLAQDTKNLDSTPANSTLEYVLSQHKATLSFPL